MAHWLQYGPERQVDEAFRGVGKSWIAGAFVPFCLRLNPDERVLFVSAGETKATQCSYFVKRLIDEMPMYQCLRPKPGQRTSILEFDVGPAPNHQSPSVKAAGITGQITGSRATRIIADDIEVTNNSDTVAKREKLAELIKEFDAIIVPGGRITFLGTPQTEESIYNKQLRERGYTVRVWPVRVPTPERAAKYGGTLAPMITELVNKRGMVGQPVDPKRFDDTDLAKRELSYGRSGFSLQFMLDTSLSDANRYPLKLADLVVMPLDKKLAPIKLAWGSKPTQMIQGVPLVGFTGDHYYAPMFLSPEFGEYQGSLLQVDPSGRGDNELAYSVMKMLNGNLFLHEVRGLKGGYTPENLKHIAEQAKLHKVNLIRVESNFGDGMFSALLKPVLAPIYDVTIEENRSSIQKERRIIDTLEPVMNQHRLIVDEKLITRDYENYNEYADETASKYQFFYQLTHITKDKGSLRYDDRLDVVAMATAYWVEYLGKDDTTAEQEAKDAALEKELEDWGEHNLGITREPPRWFQRA